MSDLEPFPNYEAALATCGTVADEQLLSRVVAYKTAQLRDPSEIAPEQVINAVLAVAIAAAKARSASALRVLDFGGGCGVHYFCVKPVVTVPLRWAIAETETMVRRATEMVEGQFTSSSTISAAVTELGGVDLVLASGSLQYVPNPLASLRDLIASGAPYLALARFPIWDDEERIGVQTSRLSHNGIGPLIPELKDLPVRTPVTLTLFHAVEAPLASYHVIFKTASRALLTNLRGLRRLEPLQVISI